MKKGVLDRTIWWRGRPATRTTTTSAPWKSLSCEDEEEVEGTNRGINRNQSKRKKVIEVADVEVEEIGGKNVDVPFCSYRGTVPIFPGC